MIISPNKLVELLADRVIGQEAAKRTLAIALKNRWRDIKIDSDNDNAPLPKNVLMVGQRGVGKQTLIQESANILNLPYYKANVEKYIDENNLDNVIHSLANIASLKLKSFQRDLESSEAQFDFRYDVDKAKQMLIEITKVLKPLTNMDYTTFKEVYNQKQKDEYMNSFWVIDPRVRGISSEYHKSIFMLYHDVIPMEIDINNPIIEPSILSKSRIEFKKILEKYRDIFKIDDEYRGLLKLNPHQYAEHYGIVQLSGLSQTYLFSNKIYSLIDDLVSQKSVLTKQGLVSTKHILFVLTIDNTNIGDEYTEYPKLFTQFPVKTQLDDLKQDDYYRILKFSKSSVLNRYLKLLEVDKITVKISDDAIEEIAKCAVKINKLNSMNIGANALTYLVHSIYNIIAQDKIGDKKKAMKINIDGKYIKSISKAAIDSIDII